MKGSHILVTGANSGLGKHCCQVFQGIPFTRQTTFADISKYAYEKPFSVIIHAAFNTKSAIASDQLYTYLNDTMLLTKQLVQLPHEKFIFISSSDVYPKNDEVHQEDEVIHVRDIPEIYALSKLMSESIVQHEANQPLILRPTAMLGCYAKPNSVIKILTQDNPQLTLAANSTFNYIRHADISRFIQLAMAQDLTGIYNMAAASNIELAVVSEQFKRPARFGGYTYRTGNIVNHKARLIFNHFYQTSLENIQLFLQEING